MRGITENCEYAVKPIITAVSNIGGPMERRVARVIRSTMIQQQQDRSAEQADVMKTRQRIANHGAGHLKANRRVGEDRHQ